MHTERRSFVEGRLMLACRVRQFMPPQRRKEHAEIPERAEGAFEGLVGVSFADERMDQRQTLVRQ